METWKKSSNEGENRSSSVATASILSNCKNEVAKNGEPLYGDHCNPPEMPN